VNTFLIFWTSFSGGIDSPLNRASALFSLQIFSNLPLNFDNRGQPFLFSSFNTRCVFLDLFRPFLPGFPTCRNKFFFRGTFAPQPRRSATLEFFMHVLLSSPFPVGGFFCFFLNEAPDPKEGQYTGTSPFPDDLSFSFTVLSFLQLFSLCDSIHRNRFCPSNFFFRIFPLSPTNCGKAFLAPVPRLIPLLSFFPAIIGVD